MISIFSSTSVVLGLNDKIFHDCNCSLFVFHHGLYLCKNIIFSMVRSLNFDLFVWNQTNAVLSNVCSAKCFLLVFFHRIVHDTFGQFLCSLLFLTLSCPKCALVWGNCCERLGVEIFVRVLRSSRVKLK